MRPFCLFLTAVALVSIPFADSSVANDFQNSPIVVSDPMPAVPEAVKEAARNMSDAAFQAWVGNYNKRTDDAGRFSVARYGQVFEHYGYIQNNPVRRHRSGLADTRYYGTAKVYDMYYRDFNDAGGGMATLYNPYCRKYFAR